MKRFMFALIIAALAAFGASAQNTPWTDVVDNKLVVRNQIPIQSSPIIDETGSVSYPVSEYKLIFYYPTLMEIPGYIRTLSFPVTGRMFKAQIKDAKDKISVVDLPVTSVSSVVLSSEKEEQYVKIVLRVPSNYLKVYLVFDAIFTPIQEGEDVETRQVLSMIGYDERLFKQPAIVSVTKNTSSSAQFVPNKTIDNSGLR